MFNKISQSVTRDVMRLLFNRFPFLKSDTVFRVSQTVSILQDVLSTVINLSSSTSLNSTINQFEEWFVLELPTSRAMLATARPSSSILVI